MVVLEPALLPFQALGKGKPMAWIDSLPAQTSLVKVQRISWAAVLVGKEITPANASPGTV